MITLTCTKCKNTLEMDEAFAGGVCRCQYCGTIQTVPSHLKHSGRPASPVASGQKALYGGRGGSGGPAVPSSGLDDLANAVASSSGLSSGGLVQRRPTQAGGNRRAAAAAPAAPNRTPLYLILGVVALAIVGVIVFMLTRNNNSGPETKGNPQNTPVNNGGGGSGIIAPLPTPTPTPVKPAGPHFLTLTLDAKKVIFLLDRGGATQSVFDPLKFALFESVESLGADKDFQALCWTAGGPKDNPNEFAYPKGKTVKATAEEVAKLKKEFEDISAGNTATDITAVIKEAMKRNPDRIIIATGKGLNLDDTDVQKVKKARGSKSVVIDTVDLSEAAEGRSALEAISRDTNGTYIHIRPGELRAR